MFGVCLYRSGILGCCMAFACITGCGHSGTAPVNATKREPTALHRGPLSDYVPSAGLRWLFVGSPQAFAQRSEFLTAFQQLMPKARLDAFAASSGVELRTLPEGCIAGFDYGTVYLARVTKDTARVRERFETRLVSDAVRKSPQAGVWRVTGLIANTPESLLVVDDDFAAISVGDPLLVRVVESFALGRLKKSSPALMGAALSTLPKDLASAPLRFYAPGPFRETWAQGVQGLLARAYAVGAAFAPSEGGAIKIHLVITGAFGPDVAESRERILKTWGALLSSPVGHVLELEHGLKPGTFVLEVRDDQATLDFAVDAQLLMKGLSTAVAGDTKSLFDG